jgi:hypothetical protein
MSTSTLQCQNRLRLARRSSSITLSLSSNHPQCQTSRRFTVSTGIQTYGSNGTGGCPLVGRKKMCPDLSGFYRNQVLPNKDDGFAVKAILAHDALTHPDHPLRIAGKQGIELFIGEPRRYAMPATQQTNNPSFRYPGKRRSAPHVLFCASRIRPLLGARNGLHKRTHSAPIHRLSPHILAATKSLACDLQDGYRTAQCIKGLSVFLSLLINGFPRPARDDQNIILILIH